MENIKEKVYNDELNRFENEISNEPQKYIPVPKVKKLKRKEMKSELEVGDKVLFLSHGRIVGVTDVQEVKDETVILTKSHSTVGKEIPKAINQHGFITKEATFSLFLYCEEVCKKLGFDFENFD